MQDQRAKLSASLGPVQPQLALTPAAALACFPSSELGPGEPALRLAKAANATTPEALQAAVTESVRNIVITEHLDMTQSPHERDTREGALLLDKPVLRIRKNTRSIVVCAPQATACIHTVTSTSPFDVSDTSNAMGGSAAPGASVRDSPYCCAHA